MLDKRRHPLLGGLFVAALFVVGSLILDRDRAGDPMLYAVAIALGLVFAATTAWRRRPAGGQTAHG